MPGRGWYVLAAAIFLAGMIGSVWYAVTRVVGMESGLIQIVVPGTADLELKQRGTYTIFHERTSQVDGRLYTANDIAGLRVAVRSVASGQDIALRRPAASSTYTFSGRSGASAFAFTVDVPGTYRVTAAYDDGRPQPQTVLAVGTGLFSGLFTTIAVSGAIALVGTAVAMIMFIVVLLKRRKALRGYA